LKKTKPKQTKKQQKINGTRRKKELNIKVNNTEEETEDEINTMETTERRTR
jgi:hypothetical protein